MDQIIKNAIVVFKNGSREVFKAISIDKNGVYTGHINSNLKNKKSTFIEYGFIPRDHIEKIYKSSENDHNPEIDLI